MAPKDLIATMVKRLCEARMKSPGYTCCQTNSVTNEWPGVCTA